MSKSATKKSSKGITLSAGAAAFDAANVETPAVETVETPAEQPATATEQPAETTVETTAETETPAEGFPLPTVDLAPTVETEQTDEPVLRRHMTNVVKGLRQNGVGVPAINGKCHDAWRMFDALTYYEGEGDDAKLHTPALGDCLIEGAARGLNPGNIKVEYPHWRKFNGFATVTRRATRTAPVAPAPVETAANVETPAPADAE